MKVLVIQQKMIGDVLTSSILFEAIRKVYPEAELHYLIKPHTFAVVENNPNIDQIIFDQTDAEGNPISFLKFTQRIRKERYDVVLDAYSKLGSAVLSFLSKAKIRSGRDKWYTRLLYTQTSTYEHKPVNQAGLAIQFRLKLGECIGLDKSTSCQPKIHLAEAELRNSKSFLNEHDVNLEQPVFMIGVLGSNAQKTYPLPYLAKLLDQVVQHTDAQLLFNYIPSQLGAVKRLYNLCSARVKAKLFLDCYAKNLRQFIAICAHCHTFLGNEGGAVHMAKAVGIPTFAIYAPQIETKAWSHAADDSHKSVHLKSKKPELFAGLNSQKEIIAQNEHLYQQFKPELIQEDLLNFLNQIKPL